MRFVTLLKLFAAACVAFAIALVAVVKTIDVHQYRLLVVDLLHAATGRSVDIRGDFQLSVSFRPRIVATDVAIANLPGARRPALLTVARVEAEIGLLALLRRHVEVSRLTLVEPHLTLEIDEAGQANWHRAAVAPMAGRRVGDAPDTSLRINAITVEGGRLVLQDRSARSVSVLSLDQVAISAADADTPIAFSAKGQFGRLPLDISGTTGSFDELESQRRPFPLKVQATAGANHALVDGRIASPATLDGLDLSVALQGNDVAEAAQLFGRGVPPLGPFRASLTLTGAWTDPAIRDLEAIIGKRDLLRLGIKGNIDHVWRGRGVALMVNAEADSPARLGKLLDADLPMKTPVAVSARLADTAEGWHLSDLKAGIGKSDLAGEMTLATTPRPSYVVVLASKLVDLSDFGFKPMQPTPRSGGEPLFSDDGLLPLASVTSFDLDVTWRAEKLAAQGATLCTQPGEAMLLLRSGVLMMRPFTTPNPTSSAP